MKSFLGEIHDKNFALTTIHGGRKYEFNFYLSRAILTVERDLES